MIWQRSYRFDPVACRIADRHYNRRYPGTNQFVPPGRCIVLVSRNADAVWVTSWPFAEYVRHRWGGRWVCSCFRKEGPEKTSSMIRDAIAATRWEWEPPPGGIVTFINPKKVRPIRRRGVDTWGYSWLKAGWTYDGLTQGGLLAFVLEPDAMPPARPPVTAQLSLWKEDRC